jgi:hypothetical protein
MQRAARCADVVGRGVQLRLIEPGKPNQAS